MADLRHLSKEERDKILSVIKRENEIREEDQKTFDEMKMAIKQLQVHPSRPGIRKDILCDRCNKTFKVNKKSFCPRCHQKVCKNCKVEQTKGGKWICNLCVKQRQLEEMTGAWVLKYQKRKHTSDGELSEGELQMSPVAKRLYDGIHSVSPSEEIRQLLMRYSARFKKQQKLEESKPAPVTLNSIVNEKKKESFDETDKNQEVIVNGHHNPDEDRVSLDRTDKESGHHVVGEYNVVAEVYTIDDFTQSTKIRHGVIAESELNNNEKELSQNLSDSDHIQESIARGSLEMTIETEDEIKPCPIHENGRNIEPATVEDYDIIRTPLLDRKEFGTPQVGGSKFRKNPKYSGLEGSNSSFEDVDDDENEDNPVVNGSLGSTGSKKSSKHSVTVKKQSDYYDDEEEDYGYSFTSSMDLSIHQSYIESYYGD